MLGRLEQQDGVRAAAFDFRSNRHPYADFVCRHSDDVAHQSNALCQIDQHDRVRIGGRPGVNDGDGVNSAASVCRDPLPIAIAGARFGNPRREEESAARKRTLQTKLTPPQRVSPLLLRPHRSDVWDAQ